jgi:hypothetical protein
MNDLRKLAQAVLSEGPDRVFEEWHQAKDQVLFLLHASVSPHDA